MPRLLPACSPFLAWPRFFATVPGKLFDAVRGLEASDCWTAADIALGQHQALLVLQRGDTAASQVVLQEAPSPECAESHKRLVHGLVRYVAWAHSNAGVDKENLLRQARVGAACNLHAQ